MRAADAKNAGVRVLVFFLVCVAAASARSGQESPTEVVRSTITEVFHILEDPKLKDPAKLLPRRRLLEDVIAARFDYAEMSKRALAASWTPLTPAA